MSWSEKAQLTTFDQATTPIDGLVYLDGDLLARKLNIPWTRGQKFPLIIFDSGFECPIWDIGDPNNGIVHLFGEVDLPYRDTIENALAHATDIAEQCGYEARRVGEDKLEVKGHTPDEHLLITYNADQGVMADVVRLKREWAPPVHSAHVLMNEGFFAYSPEKPHRQ